MMLFDKDGKLIEDNDHSKMVYEWDGVTKTFLYKDESKKVTLITDEKTGKPALRFD